ncbi:hypothetical protein [Anaerocolumna xylanovorans]|uniref:Uncharacterized protein n=1 Tax=Anaerocolumna xylanovorans DSM 12503 TaxID=1121345 RepID=A0A1M7YFX1_9FIRM|nr:hypothetical protein [Anaerocolumna xylanovorans]SHO51532.1 hypothetical protein SAMN02745217_03244 [Anaerocolumna xylanovorans DSM 12503]
MDLTLAERFALISFNSKESEHREVAKQNVLKILAVAVYLEENYNGTADKWNFNEKDIKVAIKKANKKALERTYAERLQNYQLISRVSSLLGCDLYFDKNIKLKTYVSNPKEFDCQLDLLKAEFLEEGPISDESIIMVWLLLESLCFFQVFSLYEQDKITKRITTLRNESTLAKALYPIELRSLWGTVSADFLRMKSHAAATETGKGLNFIFPFFERKQSIFIDTEGYFPNAEMRLKNVLDRISAQGHIYEVLRSGDVPIVKIDNVKYELLPEAIGGYVPIHGVRLRLYNL